MVLDASSVPTLPAYVAWLPHLNATLNTLSAILILLAFRAARRAERASHIRIMSGALFVSSLFLISYLLYHAHVGNVAFAGQGAVRYLYFSILISHVLMAAVALPMILMTVWRGFMAIRRPGEAGTTMLAKHRPLARKTAYVWLYVSVTGVVVYLMAFWIYPSA